MAGGAAVKNSTTFDEAWPILQEEAINKLVDFLEREEGGQPNHRQLFTSEEYMRMYTIVYNASFPNPLSIESQKLYDQYKRTFEDYISSKVLPSLRGKENENLLRELLRRWNNYKIMSFWLSRFFNYLSRYYIPTKKLTSLAETSNSTFYNLVCREIKDQVNDAITTLNDGEREGGKIDSDMVKKVIDIYEELGGDHVLKHSEKDNEEATVEATKEFSSKLGIETDNTKH